VLIDSEIKHISGPPDEMLWRSKDTPYKQHPMRAALS
jgi:hypothetical protein